MLWGCPNHVPERAKVSAYGKYGKQLARRGCAGLRQGTLGVGRQSSTPGRNEEKNAAFKLYGGPYHVPESVEPSAHENTFFSPPAGGGGAHEINRLR